MSSSHESFPSSADLSSAEESPATSPQLTQTTSKANTNADNNTNTDSNVQTSPKGIMTAKLHPRHHFRKKSNSISNGVLQHARSINKKVSFSKFAHTNSSQVFTSSASSSGASSRNSSDSEDDDDDDEDTHNPANITNSSHPNPSANPGPHPAHFLMSVTPSPNTISPSVSNSSLTPVTSSSNFKKNYALRKLSSYPYAGERMGVSKSLDSQLLESRDSSNVNLPEFNKRPLTDTPIVSSMASPETREQSSDDEDEDESHEDPMKKVKEELKNIQKSSKNKDTDEMKPPSISRTRNISDLNLADMNPNVDLEKLKDPEEDSNKSKNLESNTLKPAVSLAKSNILIRSESISPMTSTVGIEALPEPPVPASVSKSEQSGTPSPMAGMAPLSKKISLNEELRSNLLQDLPLELQEQFEKTPSIEKLKSLLLTKPPPSARKTYTLNIPGQTSSKTSPDGKIASVDIGSKLVIVMVGLPARGKSYITNKLTRYLNWLQHDCRVFNVGNTRRKDKNNAGPEKKPLPDAVTPTNQPSSPSQHNADFFSPDNKSSNALREKWAMDTLDNLLDYIVDGPGSVGIFDATNSTKSRRLHVLKRINERTNGELKVLYLESICSDPAIIESNIRLKLSGPDYRDMDPEVALKDFVGRLHNYEKAYETIDEEEEKIPQFQYVKMIDVGKKVVSYNIKGFLASQTIYFLLNFNLCERQIWITRHGESIDNLRGRIGGDSKLTKRGQKFSKALAKFMVEQRKKFRELQLERFSTRLELKYNTLFSEDDVASLDNIPTEPNFCVWTSMLFRAVETGAYFNEQVFSVKQMRMLNELGGGKFEGMTYDEIQRRYPKEFDARIHDKLSYRYPGVGGESYLDVLTRLRPLITEIERTTDHLLIIAHRVVLRILLAYFLNLEKSAIGELDVPLHTLYCLESKPYGTDYRMYEYDENLDWFVQVQPEHQKNIKEVGVVFRERKYSVVPTAPPTSAAARRASTLRNRTVSTNYGPVSGKLDVNNFSIRRSLSFGSNQPTINETG